MPTIQRGSIRPERLSLYIRSVPMLPDPTMAAVVEAIASLLGEGQPDLAEAGELGTEPVARPGVHGPGAGARQNQMTGPQPYAEGRDLAREPRDRGGRVPEHRVGSPARHRFAVLEQHRLDRAQIDPGRRDPRRTHHE